jgi:hypothetical protein
MKKLSLIFITFLLCNKISAQTEQDTLFQKSIEAKVAATEVLKTSTGAADALQKIKLDSAKHWKVNGIVGLNTSATFLTNWVAGGNNAATIVTYGNIRLIYLKEKFKL